MTLFLKARVNNMSDNLNCLIKEFFALFLSGLLFFSSVSFASDINNLQQAVNQHDLEKVTELLQEEGADPQKLTRLNPESLSVEMARLLLDNKARPLDPSHFLRLLVRGHGRHGLNEEYVPLIELALKEGADPNSPSVFEMVFTLSIKALDMLFEGGYKTINRRLFNKWFRFVSLHRDFSKYDLDILWHNPEMIIEKKYKNLNSAATDTLKIPKKLHYIWLTNKKQRREIPKEYIQTALAAQEFFAENGGNWQHILWTNDKELIPVSAGRLSACGVEIRKIDEISGHFKIDRATIDSLIEKGRWAILSDYLRYEIVRIEGGVYADIDFAFEKDIVKDMSRYDFFGITDHIGSILGYMIAPCFFAAKANHLILERLVDMLRDRLNEISDFAMELNEKGVQRTVLDGPAVSTMPIGYYNMVASFSHAYYQASNNGTVDVIYPLDMRSITHFESGGHERFKYVVTNYIDGSQELDFFERLKSMMNYLSAHEICGTDEHFIGVPREDGTWRVGIDSL